MSEIRNDEYLHPYGCSVEATLSVIGGRWKPVIIFYLLHHDCMRFGALRKEIEGITESTLTNRLRELERDKIISRKVYPEVPPRVEYSLTTYGRSLEPILMSMRDWGVDHKDVAHNEPYGCSVEATLSVIGGRWKPVIIFQLLEEGVCVLGHYGEQLMG